MRLSETQSQVIKHLQDGGFIHWIDGYNARCFYGNGKAKTISWATIFKLEKLGLIQRSKSYITLTDKGLLPINKAINPNK